MIQICLASRARQRNRFDHHPSFPSILLILNAVDVITTGYGLSLGLSEGNPLFSIAVISGKFFGCGIPFCRVVPSKSAKRNS